MRISNETKVGLVAATALVILIVGFNYLKGDGLFSKQNIYYAEYTSTNGLSIANSVLLRGYEVGKVRSMELQTDPVRIIVGFSVDRNIKIPQDSEALIVSADLLGDKALEIILGTSDTYIAERSFLVGTTEPSLQQAITVELLPVKNKFEELIKNIDSVITVVQLTFDTRFQDNIGDNMATIGNTLKNVQQTSARLDALVSGESARVSAVFSDMQSITRNLKENEENINKIIANVSSITDTLAKVNFSETMLQVNNAVTDFAEFMDEMRSGDGNLALMMREREIYDNLTTASKNLDLLVEEMRRNPRKFLPPLIRVGGGG